MLPPAPGRLSTTTLWPQASVRCFATSRARMSVAPPGGNGTTSRIGLVGYAGACAIANSGKRDAGDAEQACSKNVRNRSHVDFLRVSITCVARRQSTFAPETLTIRAYFGISLWMNAANCSGVVGAGSAPCAVKPLAHVGRIEDLRDLGVPLRDDVLRRAGRREQAEPRRDVEARQARLPPSSASSGASFERSAVVTASAFSLPAFTCGIALARLSNMNCVSPASSACVAGAPPLYGTWTMSVAGVDLEQLAGEMSRAAVAARAERELAGIRLRVGDEFLRRVDGQRRVDDQHVRRDRDERDRREVLHRVVRHLRVKARVHRVRRQRAHQDRVAVGRRLRDEVGADVAARAGPVVDDNALAPVLARLLRDGAADDVERSAGRKGDDELHRPVRIGRGGLRAGVRCRQATRARAAAAMDEQKSESGDHRRQIARIFEGSALRAPRSGARRRLGAVGF